MLEPLGAATARAELDLPATLHVPLFQALVERIDPARRLVVLDLGAAREQTIALFGQFRSRLDIVDLGEGLGALNADSLKSAF